MAQILRAALTALAASLFFAASGSCYAATNPVVQAGSDWAHLTPAQRQFLAPFAEDWNSFPEVGKLKWIGTADRYPKMTPTEQANVRDRMQQWSKLSPQDRAKAREQYKKLRNAPPAERLLLEQKWREYDALPNEEKQILKAAPKTPLKPANTASAPAALNQGPRPPKPVVVAPITVKTPRKALASPQQSAPLSKPPSQSTSQSASPPLSQSEPAKTPQ